MLRRLFGGGPTATVSSAAPPTEQAAAKLVSGMSLGGGALEAPRFHPTGWHRGQKFSAADDPDRTVACPFRVPEFVRTADPAAQNTVVEELELPPIYSGDRAGRSGGSFARVIRNVMSSEQCRQLLTAVNSKGFTPALVNTGGGNQLLESEYRDGWRVIVDSPEFARWLMEVLRPHLPDTLLDSTNKPAAWISELNERCRVLCYTPGQKFDPHCDGRYCRPEGHPRFGDHSRVTVQLYLHQVPSKSGGATTFFPGSPEQVACQPMTGSVLLFTQNLLHEGSKLHRGVKYTIRTEVMYSRTPPVAAVAADAADAADAAAEAAAGEGAGDEGAAGEGAAAAPAEA